MIMKSAFSDGKTLTRAGSGDIDAAISEAVDTGRYEKLANLAKKITKLAESDRSYIEPLLAIAGCLVQREFYRSEAMTIYGTVLDSLPANDLRGRVVDNILGVPDNLQKSSDAIVATYASVALAAWPDKDKEQVAAERFARNIRILENPMSRINFYAGTGIRAMPGSALEQVSIRGFKEEMSTLSLHDRTDQQRFVVRVLFPREYPMGSGFRAMAGEGLMECAKGMMHSPQISGIYRDVISCSDEGSSMQLDAKAKLSKLGQKSPAPEPEASLA